MSVTVRVWAMTYL